MRLDKGMLNKALDEGIKAAQENLPIESNPYPHKTILWEKWIRGYNLNKQISDSIISPILETKMEMQPFVRDGLSLIGSLLMAKGLCSTNPTKADSLVMYHNNVFAIKSFHLSTEDDIPNFRYGSFFCHWFKSIDKKAQQNEDMSPEEWRKIIIRCLASIGGISDAPNLGKRSLR